MPVFTTRIRRVGPAVAVVLLVAVAGILSATAAERRALAAEEDLLADRLSAATCLETWGTNEGGGPRREATVTGIAADGVRVRVTVPYAYSTTIDGRTLHADAASRAVYVVSVGASRRIAGDTVAPCSDRSRRGPGASGRTPGRDQR